MLEAREARGCRRVAMRVGSSSMSKQVVERVARCTRRATENVLSGEWGVCKTTAAEVVNSLVRGQTSKLCVGKATNRDESDGRSHRR